MSNHISHAALPYPIKGCRFTVIVPYLDADGDPTDPTTPDTEVSKDAGAFADCTEEVTTISGSNGAGYVTLTGDETNCSVLVVAAKVASGPKATLLACAPRVLPQLLTGTAQAGAAGSITLPASASAIDNYYVGCIVQTTGGTGGAGGSGSLGNQARVITAYVGSTKVATVSPSWETNPDNTTTLAVLATELGALVLADVVGWKGTAPAAPNTAGYPLVDVGKVNNTAQTAGDLAALLATIASYIDTEVAAIKAKTDNLPSDPADASDVAALIAAVNAIVTTIATYVDTEVAAIKAKTDLLPASPAAAGDPMTLTTGERTSIGTALLDLTDGVETGITLRKALKAFLAMLAGKSDGFPAGPHHFRNPADTKDRVTLTSDEPGNRLTVTFDFS